MSGSLTMVSIGPGYADFIVPAARKAVEAAEVIVSYDLYLTWIESWLTGKEIITMPLTQEKARATAAIDAARRGKKVAIISSGDIGVYGMATLVFEDLAEDDNFNVSVVPGVTAATSSASLLGAPLSHDFMTLSLSDLLCPWDWIELRARHAAEADVCLALYNVQSKQRPDGIYKILKILAQNKSPDTVCGVVRNAYRPDQSVQIMTLQELQSSQFDMLTTLIIGNRFTKRKRNWMFTPRGYNQWSTATEREPSATKPRNAVWVFSGTSDGNALANRLVADKCDVVISAVSEYGANLASSSCPGAHVVFGKTGKDGRQQMLVENGARIIVDATHPYAEAMSEQLIAISKEQQIPYIRFQREESSVNSSCISQFESFESAMAQAVKKGKKVFLSTGSKHVPPSGSLPKGIELFVRVTPDPASVAKVIEAGVSPINVFAMQGPFSKELNVAIWKERGIDVVITKESGDAGGFAAKVAAAEELGIPLLVVKRPVHAYPVVANDQDTVIDFVRNVGLMPSMARAGTKQRGMTK